MGDEEGTLINDLGENDLAQHCYDYVSCPRLDHNVFKLQDEDIKEHFETPVDGDTWEEYTRSD